MDGWENFAIAQVGASAALAGLVLVSVSVNLDRVLAEPSAPPRVAEALIALLALLVGATALLVPRQPLWLVGAELLGVGATAWSPSSSFSAARHGRMPPAIRSRSPEKSDC